jgi:hypothetical protein
MAKRIAPIRLISFFLFAACAAWCQSERPSVDSLPRLQFEGSNSPEKQHQETRTRGNHFLMLRLRYSPQHKQRTFKRWSINRARL